MDKDLEIVDQALCDWINSLRSDSPYRARAKEALEVLRNHPEQHEHEHGHGNTYVYVFPNATQPSPQAPHLPSWPYAPYQYPFVTCHG